MYLSLLLTLPSIQIQAQTVANCCNIYSTNPNNPDQPITLCHYAMRVWHKSHFNSWQLYGHSHGKLNPIGKQYDVGADSNNLSPVSFEMLKSIMKKKDNNFNYIPEEKAEEINE